MHALPSTGATAALKMEVAREIESLIDGAVLLHIPDELAWMLFLEGKDVETIGGRTPSLNISKLTIFFFKMDMITFFFGNS